MKNFKKILSFILCLAFLLSCVTLPVPVFAQAPVHIDDRDYDDLISAFEEADTGDTIVISSDITVARQITVTKNVIITSDGGVTVKRAKSLSESPFSVVGGGTLTAAGNITFDGGDGTPYSAFFTVNGGTLSLRDGVSVVSCRSYESGGAVVVNSGVCELSGVSFSGNSAPYGGAVMVSPGASGLRMSGELSFGENDTIYLAGGKSVDITGEISGSGNIVLEIDKVSEGTAVAYIADPSVVLPSGQVSRFSVMSGGELMGVVADGSYLRVGFPGGVVAKIGAAEFRSLADAFASVPAGGSATVTLCADTMLEAGIDVSNSRSYTLISDGDHVISRDPSFKSGYMFNVNSGASLTVGTSGGTLTVSGASVGASAAALYCGGRVTLGANSRIENHVNVNPNMFYQGTVFVPEGGSLTVSGGRITSNTAKTGGAVLVYGGTVNMTSGLITGNAADNGGGVYISSGGFNMSGGAVEGNHAAANGGAFYCVGTLRLSGSATVSGTGKGENDVFLVTGRTISVDSGWVPAYGKIIVTPTDTEMDTKIAVYSSDKNVDPERFGFAGDLAAAFKPRAKDNYVYIGPFSDDYYVAYIGDVAYTSLVDAVAAAPEGETPTTITVVGDIEMMQTVIIPTGKNIIITVGNAPGTEAEFTERVIRRASTFDLAFFSVGVDASLRIFAANEKKIILDGSALPAESSMIVTGGLLEIGEGTVLRGNSVTKNEKLTEAVPALGLGGAVLVEAQGTLNMTGGTIENNYAARGGAVFVQDGVFNMQGGLISQNKALYGAGVYISNLTTENNVTPATEPNPAEPPQPHGVMNLTAGEISGNSAAAVEELKFPNGHGGGVYIGNAATFAMSGGTVKANVAGLGAGVYVGTLREKDEPALRVPVMELSAGAAVASDNDVYLTLVNESVISVTGALTSATGDFRISISIPSVLSQNSSLVEYRIPTFSPEQNAAAAANAVSTGAFILAGDAAQYYKIAASTANAAMLLNTAGDNAYLRYSSGRSYNGLPEFEEDLLPAPPAPETEESGTAAEPAEEAKKTRIVYGPISINSDGCITVSFEMSFYVNLFPNIHTQLVGAFPAGTRITMIDQGIEGKASYYYYEVTGKETVRTPIVPGQEAKKEALDLLEIPLEGFFAMGQNVTHYGEFAKDEKPSADLKTLLHEKLTFVIDFSDASVPEGKVFSGDYSISLEHNYPGETEGTFFNISKNFAEVSYSVGSTSDSQVYLDADSDGITVSYKLDRSSRTMLSGNGLVLIETAHGSFPEGTVFTADKIQYPVAPSSGKVAVSLPRYADGSLVPEGKFEIKVSNYYGYAIVDTTIRAAIYPSVDGRHIAAGAEHDAASEGIAYMLGAVDNWAVSVVDAEQNKPSYEFSSPSKAGTMLMTVRAKCNSEDVETVMLTLENRDADYQKIPLSTLFIGFDDTDTEGARIATGTMAMKLKNTAPNGEYRLAFTAGDRTEYVRLKIGK